MNRLCTICARGGSKGVPGKNLRMIAGRPLIAHSIGQALKSGLFDAIAVSSDSDSILAAGMNAGATLAVKRPDGLADDTAGKLPAIAHCLLQAEDHFASRFRTVVDLDATSPLRSIEDIVGAVALFDSTAVTNVITGSAARRSPYFNLVECTPGGHVTLSKPPAEGVVLRRQDSPRCFDMNASIYVWNRDAFLERPAVFYADTKLFEMPESRSHDIDTELDFRIVTFLMEGSNA